MTAPDGPLDEATADPDPFVQFGRWFGQASASTAMPEAMALATADATGRPSVRMVLLKAWGSEGFVFYTNLDSRKAHDLVDNPWAALLFHWPADGHQVRVEGAVERLDDRSADEYFASRARGSQLGAYASHQSRPIGARGLLDAAVASTAERFTGAEIPRPPWWGGLRVLPDVFEFWQQGVDRLHDRLAYARTDGPGDWSVTRLQP